jgi:hypothetical protein
MNMMLFYAFDCLKSFRLLWLSVDMFTTFSASYPKSLFQDVINLFTNK